AAYSFDENQGTVAHDSTGNHDGTIEGGASWSGEGKYGSALDFNGTNGLVKIADANDLDLTKAFTLEAWVRPDTLAKWNPAIAKLKGGPLSGYLLAASGNQATPAPPAGFTANNGSINGVNGSAALTTGTWSHLAVTYDATNLRLYLNGELLATHSAVTAQANSGELTIGYSSYLATYFDGKIDEVRVYDEALDQGEIQLDKGEAIS
ncbi:MAG TPA: LamG domain-containing protein, partial [Solirubrobacterales bacterium]|nr:LamG domain-containing protein [Solirubrobacterales bacterium]